MCENFLTLTITFSLGTGDVVKAINEKKRLIELLDSVGLKYSLGSQYLD